MLFQIFKFILTPSNLISLLFLSGLLLSVNQKSRKCGLSLAAVGIVLFFISGFGPLGYFLLGKLEHRYPPLKHLPPEPVIERIAVLAGYGVHDDYFPPSSMVNDASLFRAVEAARLWHQSPTATIFLAGPSDAMIAMAALLKALKIPDSAVQTLPASQDTNGNIQSLKPIIAGRTFVLVTSAGHMPRAVLICRRAGLVPIPAPTDYYTSLQPGHADWLPSPFHAKCFDLAIHEFMAILYLQAEKTLDGMR
jgi:uncharacterized SAM-binding protein YcdF (DUF218 family)